MSERGFDVVVLGSGTAGREAAGRLAQADLSVAIVEPELVGGECVFYACMGLGLETVGLEPGKWIDVDDQLRAIAVEGDWLHAIGDVNARALLTHISKYHARVAADNILGKSAAATADGPGSPRVLFTDPQVAAVGHTLQSALDAGLNVHTVDAPTSGNAGGNFYGINAAGTTRLVVDDDRRVVVGATITGSEVADFLQAATIAVVGEVPLERLAHAVPAFPTRSEVWSNLMAQLGF